jgi:hypothetical protein
VINAGSLVVDGWIAPLSESSTFRTSSP